MPETETLDLAARIAEESASLPRDKQKAILDFVLFIKERSTQAQPAESEGDAAWERIINDPRPRPKLEQFFRESAAEGGEEPLDLNRL